MANKNSQIISAIKKELNIIVDFLYKNNLCIEYTDYAISTIGNNKIEITRPNRRKESNILYDELISIKDTVKKILTGKEYNILLKDRSIIQFEFECENGLITKERFIYIRPFNTTDFVNDEYDDCDWFEMGYEIPLIIRIDYDIEDKPNHPKAHATINNIKYCRIPLKGPISVTNFMNFILNMFYGENYMGESFSYASKITITSAEKKKFHINWEE